MKQWTLALLAAGVSAFGLAQAAGCGTGAMYDPCCPTCYDPCMDSCCEARCGFEVMGEFLYIRPGICDTGYAIVDERPVNVESVLLPSGSQKTICTDYKPGFRAGATYVYDDGCSDVTVTYTGLWTNEKKGIDTPSSLWISVGDPIYLQHRLENAVAAAKLKVDYNVVDATVASRRMDGCNFWLRRFVGLRWADMIVRQTARYAGAFNSSIETHDVATKTHAWGVGPRFGADMRWDLICGFGIGGRVGGSILAGANGFNVRQHDVVSGESLIITDQKQDVTQHSGCHLFPEFDARLGINYLWCQGQCFSLFIEVGYEFETYINAIGRFRFNGQAGTNSQTCDSLNFDGIYVTARVGF